MRRLNWQRKVVIGTAAMTVAIGLLACSRTPETETDGEAEAAATAEKSGGWLSALAPDPVEYTLAAGAPLVVRTTSTLSSKSNDAGEAFTASLEEPIEVDGVVVAPKGSKVTGVVSSSDDGGRVKGVASIGVEITEISVDGKSFPVATGRFVQSANKTVTKDAQKVGIGAGIGAAVGAVMGGGSGAAKGAGIGAGAGTAAVLGTKGEAAVIPAESIINFTLSAPAKIQAD